ncbi:hypothetical protein A3D06_01555 [Candidatus Roizmanbacteria bacterium RIFCSPHIGHO2_02_FULL_40_9]|uniref:HTH arsR-type domain-containing protein n=2 Tax=Candidatus Roizmaniibacteriota TaxID=1752723 RepID=A0A1F7ILU9_9BACT|nr:MAG: hypothetical protein A3D06_01555 [Candidatus Roizmanbacteria bacterium RIFCSPHIGHO2_02_FULL_40_9]OGK44328.1 MAG: hypothetical protein A2957_03190 [Candidatus Roizmanbacteria bacterium RIFCSPLOWO2_01_FULL_38_11]
MLHYIIPSKARRDILSLFFNNLDQSFHLRRVSRELDLETNAVKRELDILEKAKVLTKEKRLNKSIYSVDHGYLFYDEFIRIFSKESKIVQSIFRHKMQLGKIDFVTISMKLFKKEKIASSQVYALFVGVIVAPEVQKMMQSLEKEYPFEINYTIMTKEELAFRKKQNDPFIWDFLKQPKVMVIGNEAKLMA